MLALALALHLLSTTVWVGGMFFAYVVLRPVAGQALEPPVRLTLWCRAFERFFPWVWGAVIALPVTGYWMIFTLFGGMAGAGMHVHVMQGLAWLMIALFLHLYFAPFRRLRAAVAAQDWSAAARHLDAMRKIVATNLTLGLITIAAAGGGRLL